MSRGTQLAADLLAIDVGNSKVEAVLFRDGAERFRWRLPYTPRRSGWTRPFARAAKLAWQDMTRHVPIYMASVAPSRAAVIEVLLKQAGARRIHRVGWRDPWPFRRSLRQPQGVGADRLGNVAGLVALGVRNGIAIDAGTAVTIDVLQRRCFVGGLILPGASLMSQSLQAHTALLPRVDWCSNSPLVGDDTESALRAGITHGLTQAVSGLSKGLLERLGNGAVAVVSGGQGADLAEKLPFLRHEPDLLFQGLRLLARRASPGRARRGGRSGKKA
jgi:type III pantothenate kinase